MLGRATADDLREQSRVGPEIRDQSLDVRRFGLAIVESHEPAVDRKRDADAAGDVPDSEASMFYTAYFKEGAPAASRPMAASFSFWAAARRLASSASSWSRMTRASRRARSRASKKWPIPKPSAAKLAAR